MLFSAWRLPPRHDSRWEIMKPGHPIDRSLLLSFTDHLRPISIAETVEMIMPLDMKATVCPVNPGNREEWTQDERTKASKAKGVCSLDELREQVSCHLMQLIWF